MITASLRATATAATCGPRRLETRWKKARKGPGPRTACQAASTSMVRAWVGPCLVMRPCRGRPSPDWCTLGFSPREATRRSGPANRATGPIAAISPTATTMSHYHVDARDRHQPRHVRVGQRVARQLALDDLQILAEPVVLAQVP